MKNFLGWHFLRQNGCLNHPPHIKVMVGEKLIIEPPIELCKRGFHACRRSLDALSYAPGPIVCRVILSGLIVQSKAKAVASERTVLWMADATRLLHEFACWCATQALERERVAGRELDPRSWRAIEVKLSWLEGQMAAEELAAAWDASWVASMEAVAWAAARAAAWAAGDASWAAARDAAAWATVAWAAARNAHSKELTRRLNLLKNYSKITTEMSR